MRKLLSMMAMVVSVSSPAFAVDGGIPVVSFADKFSAAMQEAGSDMPVSIGSCASEGKSLCNFEYGSVNVLVEGDEDLDGLANRVTFKATVTTPMAQLLEAMEYSTRVIRPELTPYEARRFGYRAAENLVITEGTAFTDYIDGYQVETSEIEGDLVVAIAAPVF